MTDKKSSESRRKLLKSIAAGTGTIVVGKSLPENWTKPVVNSVMLPAHAQTSVCTPIASASAGPVSLPDRVNIDIDIPVTGTGTQIITKITIDLDITHTWLADLDISLTSPQGTTSLLINRVCGSNDDMNVTLDDNAGASIGTSCASPYTGTYNTGGGLNAFNGEDPNGTWVLNVTDQAGADQGTLNIVTLNVASTCV